MLLCRNFKNNNAYPCKPQFYYIKVGFKGGKNYIDMFFVMKLALTFLANCLRRSGDNLHGIAKLFFYILVLMSPRDSHWRDDKIIGP